MKHLHTPWNSLTLQTPFNLWMSREKSGDTTTKHKRLDWPSENNKNNQTQKQENKQQTANKRPPTTTE